MIEFEEKIKWTLQDQNIFIIFVFVIGLLCGVALMGIIYGL